MTASSITLLGRAAAERLMSEHVVITRRSDEPVTDPDTAVVSYPTVTIYEGRGRLQYRGALPSPDFDAGQRYTVTPFLLQVPVGVDLRIDDEALVASSQLDPLSVDRRFRVTALPRKTHATAIRASVTEVQQ
ncbi:DUF6093 family protein [Micrococcus sp.]|uniref:DUF6093 family protein n=1 Tax=Micrococcus sp. TaxID=1271 RepID=UPI002A911D46|nr:DUF6093 family protein [Micrococcus sp.]MDY6054347.1 DUF6093 family protein [Micrococcus sp.]